MTLKLIAQGIDMMLLIQCRTCKVTAITNTGLGCKLAKYQLSHAPSLMTIDRMTIYRISDYTASSSSTVLDLIILHYS